MGFVLKSARFLHLHAPLSSSREPISVGIGVVAAPRGACVGSVSDIFRCIMYSPVFNKDFAIPYKTACCTARARRRRSLAIQRAIAPTTLALWMPGTPPFSEELREQTCAWHLHANCPCGSVFLLAFWGAREGLARASSRLGSVQVGLGGGSELECMCWISPLRVFPGPPICYD